MAERFGGKFSPQNSARPSGPGLRPDQPNQRSPDEGRTNFLFLVPLVFLFNAFKGEPRALILGLAACAILLLAAWLTREGIRAELAYDARKIARRPAIPRKIFGAVLTGAGLFAGGLIAQPGVLYPALFAIAGFIAHMGAFGPDPLRDKGTEGLDDFQTDRVARAVDEAEAYLASMKDAILRAKDRALEIRVARFTEIARTLFRGVESDPGDLTAARKFLSVYLMGARDATVKFADAYGTTRDPKIRADYEDLLTDLETHFAERTQALLSDTHTDLNVEIQVLRERLQLET
ncbi:MAG: 5-bromo-4-chloroindolyl phosphate hydrolysis family protein [Cypionkella sp.]|nr:5-bromo-4-chloroindolyl phosphate hydrolysis family protein [Cypionkella sp.]